MTNDTRPNVLLVAIDTLRSDHLSCYGYDRLTSPHIDRFASEGALFVDSFSPHIPTHPGFTTLMTGKDAVQHQIVAHGTKRELSPDIHTLAELLKQRGYATGAADNLGRWFNRGFDRYEGYKFTAEPTEPWYKADEVNKTALPMLENLADESKPFFMFVHYWDPHTPYLPPQPFRNMFYGGDPTDPAHLEGPHSMRPIFAVDAFANYFKQWLPGITDSRYVTAIYDSEIAYVDVAFKCLLTKLEAVGKADNTLVVLIADHGEVMDEHVSYYDHHGLYDSNLRVPIIMRYPKQITSGKRVRGTAQLYDIAPTILDATGNGELIESEGLIGTSLLPAATGQTKLPMKDMYITENTWMKKHGVRTRRWKYIEALEPDFHGLPPVELFDLEADPTEQCNLAEQNPQLVKKFQRQYQKWLEGRMQETGQPDPQAEQAITLRRIGAMSTAVPKDMKLE